jgi:hypothetical protein
MQGHAGWVRDLHSRYGTLVNHRPVVGWVPFGPDDRISVGGCELRVDGDGGLCASGALAGATMCAAGLDKGNPSASAWFVRNGNYLFGYALKRYKDSIRFADAALASSSR